jgi:hypothetical protein
MTNTSPAKIATAGNAANASQATRTPALSRERAAARWGLTFGKQAPRTSFFVQGNGL